MFTILGIGNLLFTETNSALPFVNNIVAGLEHAKKCVTEMVIWPLLRPDIFKGCRSPGRGLLLFGPPVSTTCIFLLIVISKLRTL